VLHQTEDLCRLIRDASLTMDEWRRQREALESPTSTVLERGFAALYLNRTNRSGVISGGVIGGQNQGGTWKLDARFNKATLAAKVRAIALWRDRIALYGLDAGGFLTDVVAPLKDPIFLYLDPPYYARGKDLYHSHYGHEDHVALAKLLKDHFADRPWLVSYDDTPEIRTIYEGSPSLSYTIGYSAASRYRGAEIIFFGPAVKEPLLVDPLTLESYARLDARKAG
jgi:DNA adenine methylase